MEGLLAEKKAEAAARQAWCTAECDDVRNQRPNAHVASRQKGTL